MTTDEFEWLLADRCGAYCMRRQYAIGSLNVCAGDGVLLLARLSHTANWKQNTMCDKRLM